MTQVEKYSKSIRILHWIHTGAFIILFLSGLLVFIPGLGSVAEAGWVRIVHRVGATIFIIIPFIYLIFNPKSALRGIRIAFAWNCDDIGWFKALPAYYFKGDESKMPPQGKLNTGQKLWWLLILIFGVLFVISGSVMWFAKTSASPVLLQQMVHIHDVSFILTGVMFFIHIYTGVFHPHFNEAWKAITGGKISAEYAKKHHGKWYTEISKGKDR